MNNSRLLVSLKFDTDIIEVGELVVNEKKIYFKYFRDFIASGLQISPFKMPLNAILKSAEPIPFDGLFGVFDDSLPDGWGRLLLDRSFMAKGLSLNEISPINRLAFVGNYGMGALIYEPNFDLKNQFLPEMNLDALAAQMSFVLQGSGTEIIDELYQLGGSSGGARPKVMIGYNPISEHIIFGNHDLPAGYEHWIIKFSSSYDSIDASNIEFAYYLMAKDAGIEMATSKLFKGLSGKYYFGTKRFDRIENKRLHMHSASGLLHDNFRLSTMDYGHLMDAAFRLEQQVAAYNKILRLAAFNVYSHNKDDHSKNFSFLMNKSGIWSCAPAYDLTYSNSSHGLQSTMVYGESKNPTKKHLLNLAQNFSMKRADIIIDEVQTVLSKWSEYAKNCGVSIESTTAIQKKISHLLKT